MIYENEYWKNIKEFPRYFISNYGRVKSKVGKEERILIPNIIKGYEYVKLYRTDSNRMSELKLLRIHRLVA